ncbi:hypothetical protein BC830DRAFT_1114816 [Chytriomyces sp. MP71]|nr:hypothetical protein BC830DRAFT_1114816 [Chytriomyces sp. MP71]
MAAAFENRYRWRKTDKPGSCWICKRDSASVLVSGENADWFFCCESHITSDPAFCKELVSAPATPPPATPIPSAPASSPPATAAEDKKSVSLFAMFDSSLNMVKPPAPTAAAASASQSPKPTGPRYFALDSKIFFMRQAEKRDKRQRTASAVNKSQQLKDLNNIKVPQNGF